MSGSQTAVGKHVLVPVADGTEELEATAIITVLHRAGVKVTVASVTDSLLITGPRGVHLQADCLLSSPSVSQQPPAAFDGIFLPGGAAGAEGLRDCPALISLISSQRQRNALYGAICASPAVALGPHQLLPPRSVGHPSFDQKLKAAGGGSAVSGSRVVWDEQWNCITSIGPGSAVEFALSCVGLLCGWEKVSEVAGPMCLNFTPARL
jgi:4-methyl-5(b-hydroxyethyl)-thiazole monophosphate biosynthesis